MPLFNGNLYQVATASFLLAQVYYFCIYFYPFTFLSILLHTGNKIIFIGSHSYLIYVVLLLSGQPLLSGHFLSPKVESLLEVGLYYHNTKQSVKQHLSENV